MVTTALAIACVVTGCATDADNRDTTTLKETPTPAVLASSAGNHESAPSGGIVEGPFAAAHLSYRAEYAPRIYFDQAGIVGVLVWAKGCLLIETTSGPLVAVFTSDYTWDEQSGHLSWPGGGTALGQRVAFSGGYEEVAAARADRLLGNLRPHVLGCMKRTDSRYWSYLTG